MTDFKPLPTYRYLGMKLPKSRRFETDLKGYESWASFLQAHGGCKVFSFSNGNLLTNCPFHDDRKPSFGLIHNEKNAAYNCFSCNQAGSLQELVTELTGEPNAWKDLRKTLKPDSDQVRSLSVIEAAINHDYEKILIASSGPCDYWQLRGLTEETVKKYELGSRQYQVAFPVWDVVSRCHTGICYREWETHTDYPESRKQALLTGESYKYCFSKGARRSQAVFGANFLTQREVVYVFESAIDCMNHWQRTDKPSVATWGKDISQAQLDYLTGFKQVVLCPDKDRDRKGLQAAEKAETKLAGRTTVRIALIAGPFKDYTDAVISGAEPQLKVLPSAYTGRSHEVEKLYRVFKKKGK